MNEKISLEYERASLFRRFIAFLIDFILTFLISFLLQLLVGLVLIDLLFISEFTAIIYLIINYVFCPLLASLYILFRDGLKFTGNRSIGKMIVRLKTIIIEAGTNCDKKTSTKRNWIFAVGFFSYSLAYFLWRLDYSLGIPVYGLMILFLIISILWIIFIIIEAVSVFNDKKGFRQGDRMAGTLVVEVK